MKTELKQDEQIVFETQPHWFTLVGPIIATLLASILGIAIGGYGLLIMLTSICFFIYKIIERNNNLWAVTNLRVVDEFGVFSSNSKESPLDKINNVSYSQPFWGKLFGYGNVQIQTAAEIGSTTYLMVDNPKELKDSITKMQEEYKSHQIKKQATELARAIVVGQQDNKQNMASELEKLFELKQKGILTEEEYNNRKKRLLDS